MYQFVLVPATCALCGLVSSIWLAIPWPWLSTLVEGGIAGHKRDDVGPGAAHYRLVVVVTDGVVARHLPEEGHVTRVHVIEAHSNATLESVVRARPEMVVVIANPSCGGNPDEQ